MLANCLMGNHDHFVLRTDQGNLSGVMRQIDGVCTQAFNARHRLVGHLFQGRFKAILVDREAYLMEVCRYVELNPVRAGLALHPAQWQWSSYLDHVGARNTPGGLNSAALLAHLLGRAPQDDSDRVAARNSYANLVACGRNFALWHTCLRQQIYLGDDQFVDRMQVIAEPRRRQAAETPAAQRRSPWPLEYWLQTSASVAMGLRDAHYKGGLSMSAMAKSLGVSVSTVSRMIRSSQADPTFGASAKKQT